MKLYFSGNASPDWKKTEMTAVAKVYLYEYISAFSLIHPAQNYLALRDKHFNDFNGALF